MTYDELSAALTLTRKIERLQAQLDDIRATGGVGGVKSNNTPVQGGAGNCGVGQVAAELAGEIESLIRQREVEREIVRRHISKIGALDDTERKIVTLRYVECRTWKLIKRSVGYEYAHLYRLHSNAKKMIVDGSS